MGREAAEGQSHGCTTACKQLPSAALYATPPPKSALIGQGTLSTLFRSRGKVSTHVEWFVSIYIGIKFVIIIVFEAKFTQTYLGSLVSQS